LKAEVKVSKRKVAQVVVERVEDPELQQQLQQLLEQREQLAEQLAEIDARIAELQEKLVVEKTVEVERLVAEVKCPQCGATSTLVLNREEDLKNIRKVRCPCGAVLELS